MPHLFFFLLRSLVCNDVVCVGGYVLPVESPALMETA